MGVIPERYNKTEDHSIRRFGSRRPGPTFPAGPVEGDTFWKTDTNDFWIWDGNNWIKFFLNGPGGGPVTDFIYGVGLANGTATAFTAFLTQNVITSLPYDYKMIVKAYVNSGANAGANIVTLRIEDETGTHISPKSVIDGAWRNDNNFGSQAQVWSLIADKNYAAGATCGFRLAYKVNTSNIFMDGFVHVQLVRR